MRTVDGLEQTKTAGDAPAVHMQYCIGLLGVRSGTPNGSVPLSLLGWWLSVAKVWLVVPKWE